MTKHLEVLEIVNLLEGMKTLYMEGISDDGIKALNYAISIIKQHEAISEAISVERIEKIISNSEICKYNSCRRMDLAKALHKELLGSGRLFTKEEQAEFEAHKKKKFKKFKLTNKQNKEGK